MLALSTRSLRQSARALSSGPCAAYLDNADKLVAKDIPVAAHIGTPNGVDTAQCPFLSADSENSRIVRRSAERESNARGYVRKFPIAVATGSGATLTDVEGNEYLDMLGVAGTQALGHCHPLMADTIRETLDSGVPLTLLDMATPQKDEFVTELFTILPDELKRVHFCSPAGTDCLEAAIKLCKTATGNQTVLGFHGGYHGHTQGVLSLMGNLGSKSPIQGLMSGVHFLPFPYQYRNPMGIPGEEGERACLNYIETMLSDDESGVTQPACVVMEVIQGEGGVNSVSDHALREIRRITAERGIPLVIDEVQTGFCRTGDFFAYQRSGIVPDVLCMSKAIGGGQPLAVMAFTQEMDTWAPGAHTGTFRGNTLSFTCGTASIRYMKENKLWERAGAQGEVFMDQLRDVAKDAVSVGDVRGRGHMIGVELVDVRGPTDQCGLQVPHGDLAAETQMQCFRRGLILERGGRHGAVVRFLPPLVTTPEQLTDAAGRFGEALKAAEAKFGL